MGKELCDALVVCDPDIIILSVKEVILRTDRDPTIAHARWERKAVDESVAQIYGAERWLMDAIKVTRRDGSEGHALPPVANRRLHRIAVALGDGGEATIKSGDFGRGFVHVMTEESFRGVLNELDTITDLTEYLSAKEAFARSGTVIVCEGPETNLLGWYLGNDRAFPIGKHLAIFDASIWSGLQSNPAFKRRKEADKVSYAWDRLVDGLSDPDLRPIAGAGPTLNELELALRIMARERRFNRRGLASFVGDFIVAAKANKTRARMFSGPSGIIYVFVYFNSTESPHSRSGELLARCYVARLLAGKGSTLVGIGLSNYVHGVGSASDLIYLHFPRWRPEDEAMAIEARDKLGFFAQGVPLHHYYDEYPKEKDSAERAKGA
jgi:hypothetical protein